MKLLIFPLLFLIVFAFLSQLGMTTASWETNHELLEPESADGFFDANGVMVCYENKTATGEAGTFVTGFGYPVTKNYYWTNTSGTYPITYQTQATAGIGFALNSSLGLIALIVGLVVVATIAGLKIFGNGISDISVDAILKGTALVTIWGVFSVLSIAMITEVPLFGPFFYMFLTIIYCLGVVNQMGHPGED